MVLLSLCSGFCLTSQSLSYLHIRQLLPSLLSTLVIPLLLPREQLASISCPGFSLTDLCVAKGFYSQSHLLSPPMNVGSSYAQGR